jgi:hypothetical protein
LKSEYQQVFKTKCKSFYLDSVAHILKQNVIQGDVLTFMRVDGSSEPIVFAEWSFLDSMRIKRRDYQFDHLLREAEFQANAGLFSDLGDEAFIPKSVKEDYPVVSYLKLGQDA